MDNVHRKLGNSGNNCAAWLLLCFSVLTQEAAFRHRRSTCYLVGAVLHMAREVQQNAWDSGGTSAPVERSCPCPFLESSPCKLKFQTKD